LLLLLVALAPQLFRPLLLLLLLLLVGVGLG
jgi:hypothetical protein